MNSQEKQDKEEYKYTNNGGIEVKSTIESSTLSEYNPYQNLEKIEKLIKALGTMVVIPIVETNPTTFKKEQVGSSQQPILMNERREKALDKLSKLIETL